VSFSKLIVFISLLAGLTLSAHSVVARDRIAFVTTPEQALQIRRLLITNERKEILVDLNIVEAEGRAGEVVDALCEAAHSGVRVRIVTDGLAAHFWKVSGLTNESSLALNQRCGPKFEIRFWNPVEMDSLFDYLESSKLRRDHDKLMVFVGQNSLYTGDRNNQTVNYRDANSYSYHSVDGVIQGSAVDEASHYFEKVWAIAAPLASVATDADKSRLAMIFHQPGPFPPTIPALTWIDTPIRFLHYEPSGRVSRALPTDDTTEFNSELVSLINGAKHEIVISTPFLRLPDELFRAIENRSRAGVQITLVTSRFDSKIIPKLQTQNRDIERLENLGVRLMQKNSTDDLHAKLIVADGERAYFGSHNLNMRGTFMDLESGVLVENHEAAQAIRAFALDRVTPYVKRARDLKSFLIEGVLSVCGYCRLQF
jgi:phosphatidylserine/phosphatidylglycerophosphate/cardiolipin synthase-like enzyme